MGIGKRIRDHTTVSLNLRYYVILQGMARRLMRSRSKIVEMLIEQAVRNPWLLNELTTVPAPEQGGANGRTQ